MTNLNLAASNPPADAPATVLIGLDDKQKRHASFFTADLSERAVAAAQLMGMASLPVTGDGLTQLAAKLPKGKIFGSGKAFVPFVGETLFDQLAAYLPDRVVLAELRAAASAAEVEAATEAKSKNYRLPKDWSGFKPNDLVLATEGGEQDGWYECVIIDAKDQNALNLQWRDWPEEPRFERRASEVALMWSSPTAASATN